MVRTAIVIVSHNCRYLMEKNLESIRGTLEKGTYSIYVVDNGSTDGVTQWLSQQPDVFLIKNPDNPGFAPACNQGAAAALSNGDGDADIFLLNNDTRLCRNSLSNLKTALYSGDDIGAVGSVSNYAGNEQQLELFFDTPADYVEYGDALNTESEPIYEERVRLSGFAILIRAGLWQAAGGMDEDFAPGYFEDDDLCMKLLSLGYRLLLCRNSFIYHAGSQTFGERSDVGSLLKEHHALFMEKYGFDILTVSKPRYSYISKIKAGREERPVVLVVGAGLGSDLRYIKSIYPGSIVFGIERDENLRRIASKTEAVFESPAALSSIITMAVFDVVILPPAEKELLSREDAAILGSMCKNTCQVIRSPKRNIDFSKVKLIIWDMDDTFWKGTLSEGEVHVSDAMDRLIRDLSAHGIMNSISSKNDWDSVARVLSECGDLGDHFVFNNINWFPKGPQIKDKLSLMGLRPSNTLFLDDNPRNLQEALAFCPDIMVAGPGLIPRLSAWINETPASDPGLSRLKHYTILEEKTGAYEAGYDDPVDFLYDSDIRVCINADCLSASDRIAELVQRTNQLNYTKRRDGRDELLGLFNDDNLECRYLTVADKFGYYGIVGFYCLDRINNRLIHYLFSCRCMGMKIEQALYYKLGCPVIETVPPVSSGLNNEESAPWVKFEDSLINDGETSKNNPGMTILLKGPCDLDSTVAYLNPAFTAGEKSGIKQEFNYINSRGFVTAGMNHSVHIWEYGHMGQEEISAILRDAPFLVYGDFETALFSGSFDYVCYSLLPDCHAGLYRHRKTGVYISFGSRLFDMTDPANHAGYIDGSIQNHGFRFNKKILEEFSGKWEYVGATPPEVLVRNLEYMYDRVQESSGKEVPFILLLGSEKACDADNSEFAHHEVFHAEVNARIRQLAESKKRSFRLIEVTDHIRGQEDYQGCINHYSRRIYRELADEILKAVQRGQ